MSRILITGATSLLGVGLVAKLYSKHTLVLTSLRKHLIVIDKKKETKTENIDITNKDSIQDHILLNKPNVIIHTASIGNVDVCEKNKKHAYAVNYLGTKYIVDAARKIGALVVFISSNAVFSGNNPVYREDDSEDPINYYGYTKTLAENYVRCTLSKHIITRLTLMYGWNLPYERDNAVTWLLKEMDKNNKIHLVNDTYTNPILNTEAAIQIVKLIEKGHLGTYHIAGKNSINRYQFGKQASTIFGYNNSKINAVPSSYFKGLAKRMEDTTFSTEKLHKTTGYKPISTLAGLKKMLHNKNIFLT